MLTKTRIALASAMVFASTSAVLAGDNTPDVRYLGNPATPAASYNESVRQAIEDGTTRVYGNDAMIEGRNAYVAPRTPVYRVR